MQGKLLKLSVNTNFVDKMFVGKGMMNAGFQNVESTVEQIAKAISLGFAYSYQFSDGIRKTENFIATDFVAVDIDGGMSIDEALHHPLVREYCSILHTTSSHTPDHHRFRLIFALPRTVTRSSEIKALSKALARRLTGDLRATDGARFFYGSHGCDPMILGHSFSDEMLNALLLDGSVEQHSESTTFAGKTSSRSDLRFSPELEVMSANGGMFAAKNFAVHTWIYCPFHPDENPSAFIHPSRTSTFIHCTSCQLTWFMEGSIPAHYDFYEFETLVRDIKDGKLDILDREKYPLAKFVDLSQVSANNVVLTNQKHLSLDCLNKGLTFIKSPKGTGKTTYLANILKRTINRFASLEDYEEQTDFETEAKFYSDDRVLLIGHRQALIGELCQRLGLNCYLDDSKCHKQEIKTRMRRYGICLDSLWKVEDSKYDIIVIDEVEQVLNHFLSETIGESRQQIFRIFGELISRAKTVVALDADISWISYNTLTRMRTKDLSVSNISPEDVHIYINDWNPENKEIWIYRSIEHLVDLMQQDVIAGRRVFISSNSKEKIKTLTHGLQHLADEHGLTVPMLSITSDNSGNAHVQDFIKNIKHEILNYQVVLSSPSLGTGIDITFDDDEQHIDCVYGFFENQINTHFEIDQQLARVRNPKCVRVWVSPRQFQFETEFDAVKADYLRQNLIAVSSTGYIDSRTEDHVSPFYQLAAMLTSHQRASKNALLHNFIAYKERQNTRTKTVEPDSARSQTGKLLIEIGKQLKNQETREKLLAAKTLNQYDYEKLRELFNSNEVSDDADDHRYDFYRTSIELFYSRTISDDLILTDDSGKLRRQIRLFESIQTKPDMSPLLSLFNGADSPKETKEAKIGLLTIKNRNARNALLYGLLSLTPVFKDGQFDDQVVFTKDDLVDFAKVSVKLKGFVETQLETATQSDVLDKPTQHLGKLLSLVGLEFDKSIKPTKSGGTKTYRYKIKSESLTIIQEIVDSRQKPSSGWSFLNQFYGFSYNPDQIEWLSRLK